jgi:teichuronic acid biosynthesis glycosyltransferase TuaG
MAVYTGTEFLAESVGSVEGQTHRSWELLLGLNGYPADHPILSRIRPLENERVKLVHCSEAPGKSAALNHLATVAQGAIFAVLDADDVWHVEKLSRQLPYVDRYDVVGTNCEYFGDRRGSPNVLLGEVPRASLLATNHVINSSALLRREDAAWDARWEGIEDYALWLRLAAAGRTFFNVPEVLCWHRIHARSAFNTQPQPVAELRAEWQEMIV